MLPVSSLDIELDADTEATGWNATETVMFATALLPVRASWRRTSFLSFFNMKNNKDTDAKNIVVEKI